MVNCFVYVIGAIDAIDAGGAGPARTYVGWTTDLARRLARHNAGTGAKSTRGRQWRLLYAERYPTRAAAMRREWRLKRDRRLRAALKSNLQIPP